MHHTVQCPLDIHLLAAPVSQDIHAFVGADISKDRFDNAEPFTVGLAPGECIYLVTHALRCGTDFFTGGNADLSGGAVRIADAL
jgi:hypothetical protein